jgi:chromosome segregation protein
MHLKNVELVGFKSFAERTVLEFGSGISAIVGPNGCGKSNISDAIRWVLGEQSARLLRGVKMEDCIFSGTDTIAQKNMAEVSLLLTDCEKILGTDFHEVTITRRVFRSGEGQYFINKTPCRLKDIQRLFMDTGLGTNSYSVMEQGKIDQILRSRPEDRREVFEEASGITKFKADKREALRKLDQTESNLLRLADIIKEVKRQIISIQRQAGKAERYKKLFDQMRSFDVYASNERLKTMDAEMKSLQSQLASFKEKNEAMQQEIEQLETENSRLQEKRSKIESEISAFQQNAVQLDSQMDQLRHEIDINSQRIKEHNELITNDSSEVSSAKTELSNARKSIEQGIDRLEKSRAKLQEAEKNLKEKSSRNSRCEEQLDKTKHDIDQLITESYELDDRLTKSQNELHQIENRDRNNLIRRERCAAEQKKLNLDLEKQQVNVAAAEKTVRDITADLSVAEKELQSILDENRVNEEKILALQAEVTQIEKTIASLSAGLELVSKGLNGGKAKAEDVMHGIGKEAILGRLSEHVQVPSEFRIPFEALMRDYLDGLVISDLAAAIKLLKLLEKESSVSASFVVADMNTLSIPSATPIPNAVRLLEKIRCQARFSAMLERLLRNVYVVESVDLIQQNFDPAFTYVTRGGMVMRGTGAFSAGVAPQSRESLIKERDALATQLKASREKLSSLQSGLEKLKSVKRQHLPRIEKAQADLREGREKKARQEGQYTVIKSEADRISDNLGTISWELKEIEKEGNLAEQKSELITAMDDIRARKVVVKHSLEDLNGSLKKLEQEHKTLQSEVMAANVNEVQYREEVEHLEQVGSSLQERIAQLEAVINGRSKRIHEYENTISSLKTASEDAQKRLLALKEQKARNAEELEQVQSGRGKLLTECKSSEDNLRRLRSTFESQRNKQSDMNGKVIELRMRREHLMDKVTSDYHLTPDNVIHVAEPVWPDGIKLSFEQLETQVSELRAKLDAMGPVNTGAIEELQQLQERYDFLSKQQDDLVKSRQQLHDAIKKINQTTTEMFATTFARINENFQTMFSQLFGGGTAKLILTDEGDILECGIEIYARPPGKKLQSISLLSGGESTMTAVALLFAIFMVKPSPFCVLDEMDAALDDANNQRFINMLKGFLKDSQFIVITHNRQTIAAAGVLYGVTMEKDKISTIVSMRFNPAGKAEPDVVPISTPQKAVAQEAPLSVK